MKMPGKPTSEANTHVPKEETDETEKEYPVGVTRELTQTDRLNKKLLTSFLQRMNNSTTGEFTPQVENQEQQSDDITPAENEF
ncbi:uncharacterized protein LOC125501385 [Athalia rosae]|uniref:uncharacterized protein LOC125501385 n=1 Tax=Athalia rosae TaxID=37344 RepID=UPI002034086A|nr:uncharacterized protein LOC125501385 [Athalia rosae]